MNLLQDVVRKWMEEEEIGSCFIPTTHTLHIIIALPFLVFTKQAYEKLSRLLSNSILPSSSPSHTVHYSFGHGDIEGASRDNIIDHIPVRKSILPFNGKDNQHHHLSIMRVSSVASCTLSSLAQDKGLIQEKQWECDNKGKCPNDPMGMVNIDQWTINGSGQYTILPFRIILRLITFHYEPQMRSRPTNSQLGNYPLWP